MLYLKIMNGEAFVAVEKHEKPVYVCRQEKNNILVICPEPKAQGILSIDGKVAYQLDGKSSLGSEDSYMAYPISMTEYEELYEERDEDIDADIPEDNPDDENHIMTASEMRAAIATLTEAVAVLQERNDFLEDCLLEMSEEVYA